MTGPPTIETPNLVLRPVAPADADPIYAIQGNREAMRHTYWAPSCGATEERLRAYSARFVEDGFAPWTAVLKRSGDVVGWGGLNRDPFAPGWGIEVSYLIDPAHWGRGLATEIVQASLAHGFEDLGLDRIGAFAHPDNPGSIRVLEKTGFEFVWFVPELDRRQYVVHNSSG